MILHRLVLAIGLLEVIDVAELVVVAVVLVAIARARCPKMHSQHRLQGHPMVDLL